MLPCPRHQPLWRPVVDNLNLQTGQSGWPLLSWQDLNNLNLHLGWPQITSVSILACLGQPQTPFWPTLNNFYYSISSSTKPYSCLESSLFSARRHRVSVPTARYLLLSGPEQPQPQIRKTFPSISYGAKFPESQKTVASILGKVWRLWVLLK